MVLTMPAQTMSSKRESIKTATHQKGFTLVEILVVVMLLALLSSAVILSINSITNRQLRGQGDQLLAWLNWAQQASMLSGSSYGVAEHENQLLVVAPINGKWYQVVGLESWSLTQDLHWELPETGIQKSDNYAQVDIIEDRTEPQFLPFMVFSNVGLIDPIASIKLASDDSSLIIEWSSGSLAIAGVNQ